MTAPMQPMQPQMLQPPGPPPTPPWTPFATLPMDDEPAVAAIRQRRLGHLMAGARFSAQPQEWQDMVKPRYQGAQRLVHWRRSHRTVRMAFR